jgi:hypothetical protein
MHHFGILQGDLIDQFTGSIQNLFKRSTVMVKDP